jgi:hypothetical protein
LAGKGKIQWRFGEGLEEIIDVSTALLAYGAIVCYHGDTSNEFREKCTRKRSGEGKCEIFGIEVNKKQSIQ